MSEHEWLPPDRVDAAGEVLRRYGLGQSVVGEELDSAFNILDQFRREWEMETSPPLYGILRGVANDLIGVAKPLFGTDAVVSYRLKRVERIIAKLVRIPRLSLSEIQDIGGCRVILRLRELSDVPALLEAIGSHPGLRDCKVKEISKPDGYRAHHVIIQALGHSVEIQVRTTNQQLWANTVERMEQVAGIPLRGTDAPADLADALRTMSDALALADRDQPIPSEMAPRLLTAVSAIERWSKIQP